MLPRQMFLKPKAETHTNWLQHQEAAQVCEVEHQRGWARWRSTEPLPTEQKRLNQKTSDDTTNVHLSHRRSFNLPSCACESTTSTRTGQARNTRRREPNWKNDLGSDRESDLSWTMISNLPSKLQALGNTSLHDFVTLCANHLPQSSKSKEVSSCPRLCENGKLPAASQVLGCKFGRVHHSGTLRAQNRLQRSAKIFAKSPGCKKSKTANWEPGRMPLKVRSNKSWCASERRNRKRPRWSHIFFKIGLRVSFSVPTSNLKLNIKAHPSSQSQSPTSAMI